MVLDNPCKFALYKQMHRDGQGGENWPCLEKTQLGFPFIISVVIALADLFQKLPLYERPLLLRLKAGPDLQRLSFVLKENETGEVEVKNYLSRGQKNTRQKEYLSKPTSCFLPFQPLLFPALFSTVACVFHPRAAKLPSDPGERGGGASPGSGAKIQHIQTETTAGPTTTRPLTPPTCYLLRPGRKESFVP